MTQVKAIAKNMQPRSVITGIIALSILIGNVISVFSSAQ